MTDPEPARRYRFGAFEADASAGELRKQGIRIRINAQPFQVLLMLLDRPGDVLTREEIAQALWSDGTFVDYEHGVNSAVNRLRDALGDSAGNPRFVETLARRGYRFVAPVERIGESEPIPVRQNSPGDEQSSIEAEQGRGNGFLPSPEELPEAPHALMRALFLLLQVMYVGFYVGALANLAEIEDLLSPLPAAGAIVYLLIGTAAILIAVRAFLFCAILLRAPCHAAAVSEAVAVAAGWGCSCGTVAAAAVAPHQHRPGHRMPCPAGLLTVRAAFINADGSGKRREDPLSSGALIQPGAQNPITGRKESCSGIRAR